MTTKKAAAAETVQEVIGILTAAGWTEDGRTRTETVRIPTTKNPVYGRGAYSGGEVRTFGGRLRFAKGDRRVTVGKVTTNFYEVRDGEATNFTHLLTKDVEKIRELAAGSGA